MRIYNVLYSLLFLIILLSCANRLETYIYVGVPSSDSQAVVMEQGGIKSNGIDDVSILSYKSKIRSAYFICTNGATSISIPGTRKEQCTIWQYDKSHNVISYSTIDNELILHKDCFYIRFDILASNFVNEAYIIANEGDVSLSEEKRVQQTFPYERLIFDVHDEVYTTAILMLPKNYDNTGKAVPLIIWDSGDGSFVDWENYAGGSLPGRLNGICYLRDQGFAVLEIYSWGSYYYTKYPACGSRSAMPIPTHLATHQKGVEYVLDRYNIDAANIFHVSKSGSGKLALYYAMTKPSFNLKSIYAFAPVFDDLNFLGWENKGYRQALYEELDLQGTKEQIEDFIEGTHLEYDIEYSKIHNIDIKLASVWQMHKPIGRSFIIENAEKFQMVSVDWMNVIGQTIEERIADTHRFSEEFWQGYNRHYSEAEKKFYYAWDSLSIPATRTNTYSRHNLVRQSSGIPFTVIMSPSDEQTPYWNALEVVNQLKNGGGDAEMVTLDTGGHFGPDASTNGANFCKNLTTRLGVSYSGVSIGWYIVVEDIYNRFINN